MFTHTVLNVINESQKLNVSGNFNRTLLSYKYGFPVSPTLILSRFFLQNALDLSAPASGVLLKSRSSSWFQLSGHPDSLAPAGPGTVWKKRSGCPDDTERAVYEELSEDALLRDIIPKYYRQVDYQGEKFIELQDLLHEFRVRPT